MVHWYEGQNGEKYSLCGWKCLMDHLGIDVLAACLSIDQNCTILTIHGSEDEIVPSQDALEFAKLITHKLHIVGADHRYLLH